MPRIAWPRALPESPAFASSLEMIGNSSKRPGVSFQRRWIDPKSEERASFPALTAVMFCIAAPAGSNVCLSLGIRVSGHDFSRAVDAQRRIGLLEAPGFFALPSKSRQGLYRLRKNPRSGKKDVPQGLKADVFSIVCGTTKVVP